MKLINNYQLLFIFFFIISCKTTTHTAKKESKNTKSTEKTYVDSIPSQSKTEKKIAPKQDISKINETIAKVCESAEKVRQRVIQSSKIDTNALAKKVILPRIDNIIKSIEEIKQKIETSNPIDEDDLLKYNALLLGYSNQVDNLNANLDKKQSKTWLTDVIFKPGKYKITDLTLEEENALNDFVSDIIKFYKEEFSKSPEKKWIIFIQTIGHTDTTGFIKPYNQNELIEDLINGVENQVPTSEIDKRSFFNKRLSLFRGKSLNDFFKQKLVTLNIKAKIETEEIPMGEALPNRAYVKEIRFDDKDKNAWRRIAVSNFYVLYD